GDVVLADDGEPWRLPERAVVVQGLVHDIPALDAAAVTPYHSVDVVAQPGEQRVAAHGIAARVLEHPLRRLLVPDERVPDDEQGVALAERHVLVGGCEVVGGGPRMQRRPFESVLRRGRVELRGDDGGPERVATRELCRVESYPDQKRARKRPLERARCEPHLGRLWLATAEHRHRQQRAGLYPCAEA